jgi:hypothetical protein
MYRFFLCGPTPNHKYMLCFKKKIIDLKVEKLYKNMDKDQKEQN